MLALDRTDVRHEPRMRLACALNWRGPRAAVGRVALALALAAPPASGAAEPFAQGLLWRLDKPGVPTSWVFGTLHSNDPRVTALPGPVAHAFARARTFAME